MDYKFSLNISDNLVIDEVYENECYVELSTDIDEDYIIDNIIGYVTDFGITANNELIVKFNLYDVVKSTLVKDNLMQYIAVPIVKYNKLYCIKLFNESEYEIVDLNYRSQIITSNLNDNENGSTS